jgi:large subunit ribosomal protein L22
MQARAEARYIRTSPQKARLVIDLIRGQKAGDAINILRTTNKRIAPSVEKVLRSAIANAENRSTDVDVDKLLVTECYVNEGPRMKRVRPAPMGRAYRYQRRMAHIVVEVGDGAGAEGALHTARVKAARRVKAAGTGDRKSGKAKAGDGQGKRGNKAQPGGKKAGGKKAGGKQ